MPRLVDSRTLGLTLALIACGALGGAAAARTPLPLPWLLGSLLATAAVAGLAGARFPQGYRFPPRLRLVFIAVIGLMIGAQVTGALIAQAPSMALSLAALTLFVVLAHGANYLIFRRLGGYDAATAFYCGTPGGLMESIALGEAAGADIRLLTLQQFLRVILVVSLLPLGISLIEGIPVGSAAGVGLGGAARDAFEPRMLLLTLAAGAAGIALGLGLRLPAGQLTGPMAAAALVNAAGLGPLEVPGGLIMAAQVVVGVSLGARFLGVTRQLLLRALRLGLLSVAAMLGLAGALAAALTGLTGTPLDVLLISFAPGGVTEMSLVALSLEASPALVTLHHVYRIVLTVLAISLAARLWAPRR